MQPQICQLHLANMCFHTDMQRAAGPQKKKYTWALGALTQVLSALDFVKWIWISLFNGWNIMRIHLTHCCDFYFSYRWSWRNCPKLPCRKQSSCNYDCLTVIVLREVWHIFFCCLLHKSAAQNTFRLMCRWNNGWWVLTVHVIQTYSHNSSKRIAEYLLIWLKLKTGILSLLQKFEH